MVADLVMVAGTTVTSCRVRAHLSFVWKRMGGEWSLVWTPAVAGIANAVSSRRDLAAMKGIGATSIWNALEK